MPKTLTDLELIRELEPVAEAGMNQHLAATRNWNPHDYVPWSDGSDYGALGGHDWSSTRVGMASRCATTSSSPERWIRMPWKWPGLGK